MHVPSDTPQVDDNRVPAALEQIVNTALEAEVQSLRRPRAGSVADTAVLELASDTNSPVPDRVVCKRGGASVWTGDVIEPFVCERVAAATELPVPEVLARGSLAGTGRDGNHERWALYEHLEGKNPVQGDLEPAVRRQFVANAGRLLGRLHATPRASVGLETATVEVGGIARATDGGLTVRAPDGWHAIEAGWPLEAFWSDSVPLAGDDDCLAVLTHGDYQPSNLLVDGEGEITGVLDWGNAHVTHAAYALARAECRFVDLEWIAGRLEREARDRLRQQFREGYACEGPLEITDAVARQLRWNKCLWIVQSLANYTHIARSVRGRGQLWRQCRRLLE